MCVCRPFGRTRFSPLPDVTSLQAAYTPVGQGGGGAPPPAGAPQDLVNQLKNLQKTNPEIKATLKFV